VHVAVFAAKTYCQASLPVGVIPPGVTSNCALAVYETAELLLAPGTVATEVTVHTCGVTLVFRLPEAWTVALPTVRTRGEAGDGRAFDESGSTAWASNDAASLSPASAAAEAVTPAALRFADRWSEPDRSITTTDETASADIMASAIGSDMPRSSRTSRARLGQESPMLRCPPEPASRNHPFQGSSAGSPRSVYTRPPRCAG
jgi:hypothetical protein